MTKREQVKNGSEVPREMGINERAINRVNGRKHAILRHFARRRVVDRLTDTRLFIWGTHETPPLPSSTTLPTDRRADLIPRDVRNVEGIPMRFVSRCFRRKFSQRETLH